MSRPQRFLAEDKGKRFYLHDGTVTSIECEVRGTSVIIDDVAPVDKIADDLALELRQEMARAGWDPAAHRRAIALSKPMQVYADGEGVHTMRVMTVEVLVWPPAPTVPE
jgi:hypothetical protein